jgi:hypothetical protein
MSLTSRRTALIVRRHAGARRLLFVIQLRVARRLVGGRLAGIGLLSGLRARLVGRLLLAFLVFDNAMVRSFAISLVEFSGCEVQRQHRIVRWCRVHSVRSRWVMAAYRAQPRRQARPPSVIVVFIGASIGFDAEHGGLPKVLTRKSVGPEGLEVSALSTTIGTFDFSAR